MKPRAALLAKGAPWSGDAVRPPAVAFLMRVAFGLHGRPGLPSASLCSCWRPCRPADVFLSASEDGTVREFDVRQRPVAVHRDALAGDDSNVLGGCWAYRWRRCGGHTHTPAVPAVCCRLPRATNARRVSRCKVVAAACGRACAHDLPGPASTRPACADRPPAVDQRAERVGRSRVRVGIHSLAVDPLRPWLMLTGGTDPLLRLYDRRMLPEGDGKAPQWVSAYVPSHIKGAVLDSGRHPGLAGGGAGALPGQAVTAVAFARGGAQLVGSYSGECIYRWEKCMHPGCDQPEPATWCRDMPGRWPGILAWRR